jgi:hypothetical protein
MARNIRHRFESRTVRLNFTIRKKPYSGAFSRLSERF